MFKNIKIKNGFVLPVVIVFLGAFFTMAVVFYLFNINQKPAVDILDRSAFADYLAIGMAEILKLKIKEFPEEFRDTMRIIEVKEKNNQNPWQDVYIPYSGSNNEKNYTYFFQDFVVLKNGNNMAETEAWNNDTLVGGRLPSAWQAHWEYMLDHILLAATSTPASIQHDNEEFKTFFKDLIDKYNVIVNLRGVKREHIGLSYQSGGTSEYIDDIITLQFESEYRNKTNNKTKRHHFVTFNHSRKFTN